MTQGADDVLTALALAEMASPHTGAAARHLDVAPLLETVDRPDAPARTFFVDLLGLDGVPVAPGTAAITGRP